MFLVICILYQGNSFWGDWNLKMVLICIFQIVKDVCVLKIFARYLWFLFWEHFIQLYIPVLIRLFSLCLVLWVLCICYTKIFWLKWRFSFFYLWPHHSINSFLCCTKTFEFHMFPFVHVTLTFCPMEDILVRRWMSWNFYKTRKVERKYLKKIYNSIKILNIKSWI